MLVDVVLYGGERELLEARRDIIEPDLTVVLEGDLTFTGQPRRVKPLGGYPDVLHVVVSSSRDSDPWKNEYAQRRYASTILNGLDIPEDAIVGFFDVDEIPDPDILRKLDDVTAWRMAKYQMSLRWFQRREMTGFAAPWGLVRNDDLAETRMKRYSMPSVDGGYHLSSFLPVDRLIDKWEGFSHTEFQRPDLREWIASCWVNGVAIETGELLEERPLDGLPDRLLAGPDYWLRGRPQK